jgi:hypothetical protein
MRREREGAVWPADAGNEGVRLLVRSVAEALCVCGCLGGEA